MIFWISCNKFMEMFFREIKHSLNWPVVLVKGKLKTQQLLRKQSLKRNGYSWRKKAERREVGVSSYRRERPHLNQRTAQKFPRERGLTFEACAAAYSSLSQVGVFIVILFYISTRCSCFVEAIYQFGQGTYDSPHAACLHYRICNRLISIHTKSTYKTKFLKDIT